MKSTSFPCIDTNATDTFRKVVRTSVKLSMWHQWFNARWRLTWKRRNCWIYSRNYFCYFMDYQFSHFIDVLTTFLGLELVSSVAVYAGSESSWISSEISSFVFRRWTKVLRVWYEMRVSISCSGGPLSALTCCVNVRLLSAIKKISPLIYSQSWVGSWVYTTQAMMTFTQIF